MVIEIVCAICKSEIKVELIEVGPTKLISVGACEVCRINTEKNFKDEITHDLKALLEKI